MSNFDSDSGSESQWEDRGDLIWNEFDWERYLRNQEESVQRYLRFYNAGQGRADRIDWVAGQMGWGTADWTEEETGSEAETSADGDEGDEVYTLHQNPIYVATKAIYVGLFHSWEQIAGDPAKVPQPVAVSFLLSLHRGEGLAVEAIHALDFGDFAMAVSLFKRALVSLNASLAVLSDESVQHQRAVMAWREGGLPRLFDLREIWLRVIAECRDELEQPSDDESE
jgi:hypothetical protein